MINKEQLIPQEFTAFFPFCGLGAGALGFLNAQVDMFGRRASFRSLGGIDINQEACIDFTQLTGSPALCGDIFDMTPEEVRDFVGEPPDAIFASPPCKGYSGLLSKRSASLPKYQKLNRLVVRWVEIMLGAWSDQLPRLLIMENVPRIRTRGAALLEEVRQLLRPEGYAFHEGFHDCGEIGGLAQHRRRFLMVARLEKRCPPFLYKPPIKRVRACGEILEQLPVPGTPEARRYGKIHELPRISLMNAIRLALIPAGGDWRDLEGVLKEGQKRREVHKRHEVSQWDEPTGTIAGAGSNSVGNIADPRVAECHRGILGVRGWDEASGTVTGRASPSTGTFSVADPRLSDRPNRHRNKYKVGGWDDPQQTVIGATRPGSGAPSVADPRLNCRPRAGAYGVLSREQASAAVTGSARIDNGKVAVCDPRVSTAYDNGYRVLRWQEPSPTVAGKSACGCGAYQVADPRVEGGTADYVLFVEWDDVLKLPAILDTNERRPSPVPLVIISPDGCWHRPLTTLELATLQGLPSEIDDQPLQLAGNAVSRWRERIGNAVPVQAAEAIARQMLVSLVENEMKIQPLIRSKDVWVRENSGQTV